VAIAEEELTVTAGVLTPVAAYAGDACSNGRDTGSNVDSSTAANVAIRMDTLFIPAFIPAFTPAYLLDA
jgi:hypothetical protein